MPRVGQLKITETGLSRVKMSISEINKLCRDIKQGFISKASIVDRFRQVRTGLKSSAISPVISLVNLDRFISINILLNRGTAARNAVEEKLHLNSAYTFHVAGEYLLKCTLPIVICIHNINSCVR